MAHMAKRMKRLTKAGLLLAAAMVLFLAFHVNVFADSYTFTDSNGISWSYAIENYEGSSCAVTKGCGSIPESGEITVPGYINGLPVIVGENTFHEKADLVRATIGEGALGIRSAFIYCANLESVELPSTLVSLDGLAFSQCTKLSSIDLKEGLKMIRQTAFSKCSSLTSINIPSTVEVIEKNSFYLCGSLSSIIVDKNNNAYKDIDGVLFSKAEDSILLLYPAGKADESYSIPSGVTAVGNAAFYNSQVKEVTIPASVRELQNQAFQSARSLQTVNMEEGLKTIGISAFDCCSSLQSVDIPQTVTYIGGNCFNCCSSLSRVTLPDGLTDIRSGTFRQTNLDQSFTIPAGVKNIEWQAFNRCLNLKHFVIPDTVEKIYEEAFRECTNLQDVYIASENITMEQNVFLTCGPYDSDAGRRIFTIYGDQDSAAAEYAQNAGVSFAPITAAEYMEAMTADGPLPSYDFSGSQTGEDPGDTVDPENTDTGSGGNNTPPAENRTTMSGTAAVQPSQEIVNTSTLKKPKFKAKNKKGKKVKLSWSKVSNADGYLIYVKGPKDKEFKCRATKSAKVKSITHKGLKKGKKYKYKVAAYKVVNGVIQKGPFSKTITVKIKK